MNVLLTSAGRRTSLLTIFQTAVHSRDGRVLAGDVDPLAAALQVADDSLLLPPIQDSEYLPTLLENVHTHGIDLIVPLIDPGLAPLTEIRDALHEEDCLPLVSSRSFLDLAFDKWSTIQHFSSEGVHTPNSWLPSNSSPKKWPDPLFVKPRRGSSSKNARRIARDEVTESSLSIEDPILQEIIDAPEITVDALFDLEGTLLHYVPRLRIRTVAGESVQGRTLPDEDFDSWLRPLLRKMGTLGAQGPITVQAFLTDPEPTLSEINPRFGGGFPLAYAAGGNYPEWILQMCSGNTPPSRLGDYTSDLYMTRAYTEWFTSKAPTG